MSNEIHKAAVVADKKEARRSPLKFYSTEENGITKVKPKMTAAVPDLVIHTLTGTPNTELANQILQTGANALPDYMESEDKYNLITQSLADYAPQDANEARLVTQATVLHEHALKYLDQAAYQLSERCGTLVKDHWHTIYLKSAAKLLDLHNKTIETLTRYRQRGEQKIVVQHVNVEDGGKAIVNGGNMSAGGGG